MCDVDHDQDTTAARLKAGLGSHLGLLLGVGILVASWVLPPEGLGLSLCWFNSVLALPCPGCGMTRSIILIGHGAWRLAWSHHPFGYLVYALAVLSVLSALLPEHLRASTWTTAIQNNRLRMVTWCLQLLMVFGLVRLVFHATTGTPFPLLPGS